MSDMPRRTQLIFKASAEEAAKIKSGAVRARKKFSPWARETLLRAAESVEQEQHNEVDASGVSTDR